MKGETKYHVVKSRRDAKWTMTTPGPNSYFFCGLTYSQALAAVRLDQRIGQREGTTGQDRFRRALVQQLRQLGEAAF